jgi:hypothetical protein
MNQNLYTFKWSLTFFIVADFYTIYIMKYTFFLIVSLVFAPFVSCQNSGSPEAHKETSAANVQQNYKMHYSEEDSLIFNRIKNSVSLDKTHQSPTGELILEVGKQFLGAPYVAATLETEGEEQLVINLREMDCNTFLEYAIAGALSLKNQKSSFQDFSRYLVLMRYRNAHIDGYPSRLHYFSEWMVHNAQKGLIEIVSNEFGNEDFTRPIHFMSSHPQHYRQLSNPEYLEQIREIEKTISSHDLKFLTKDKIDQHAHLIEDGDIIAFTSRIKGLDVSHVVFAMHHQGRLHFLHASSNRKQVEISPEPLQDYLSKLRNVDGILVGRVVSAD